MCVRGWKHARRLCGDDDSGSFDRPLCWHTDHCTYTQEHWDRVIANHAAVMSHTQVHDYSLFFVLFFFVLFCFVFFTLYKLQRRRKTTGSVSGSVFYFSISQCQLEKNLCLWVEEKKNREKESQKKKCLWRLKVELHTPWPSDLLNTFDPLLKVKFVRFRN